MNYPKSVQILEVGPRDGFQSVKEFIPTETKIDIIERLVDCGCDYIQATSFVHPKAIPQMRDAREIIEHCLKKYPDRHFYALVPNMRGARAAVEAGLKEISYVISVSTGHNKANVNRTPEESFKELEELIKTFPETKVNLDAATAFGCPFDGHVSIAQVTEYVKRAVDIGITTVELCDTIGVASPRQVELTAQTMRGLFPRLTFGVHIHDTRNMGMVNSLVAVQNGITRIATTVGGMGGCPFAPGASGNTSTEDMVNMLEKMGIDTGIDLDRLVDTAKYLKKTVPANYSGHLMNVETEGCVLG